MNTSTSAPPTRKRRGAGAITPRRWLDGLSLLALGSALLLIFVSGLTQARPPRPFASAARAAAPASPSATVEGRAPLAVAATPVPVSATVQPTLSPAPSSTPPLPTLTPTPVPTLTETATAIPTPTPRLIALIAGHRNNDSGAICESGPHQGLWEVHVTTDVTARLKRLLEAKGYQVMDLDEFDSRLHGLEADALLSLHADSCVEWEGASGYKAARYSLSAIPETEDRLLGCVERHYSRATKLSQHPSTITHNMTNYHAFRKVAQDTPAVIIELGFLFHDYELLTEREDVMAEGLMLGLECFLKDEP